MNSSGFKVKDMGKESGPLWKKYAAVMVGKNTLISLLKYELITFFFGSLGGALGMVLRKKTYRYLFGSVGKNVTIGKNLTLRHPHKIFIGDNVIIDDNCVLDAKGETNRGIVIADKVFVGRNTIIYTKNGDIDIGESVNIGVNCDLYSKGKLTIGKNTMIAAYNYVMCGGQYDYRKDEPFAQQSSASKGPTTIGESCWLGAKAVVADNVSIGSGAVIGAGAVVTRNIAANMVATGIPAKEIKNRFE